MSEAIIELKNIKKHYGNHEVLKGVNMQINRGDIYGLIGKNGAGKTTIFKMILGLSEITDGTVSIAGSRTRAELYKNRSKIGFMVGSRFYNYLSAREILRCLQGHSPPSDEERDRQGAGNRRPSERQKAV